MDDKFWHKIPLGEMTKEQWDLLCDRCGRCCLKKLKEEDTGEVFYTALACSELDLTTCTCKSYEKRLESVPDCLELTPETIKDFPWLPQTCAYRLIYENKDLLPWHPLVSGNMDSVHQAGISVKDRVVNEDHVHEDEWEDFIIEWVV